MYVKPLLFVVSINSLNKLSIISTSHILRYRIQLIKTIIALHDLNLVLTKTVLMKLFSVCQIGNSNFVTVPNAI